MVKRKIPRRKLFIGVLAVLAAFVILTFYLWHLTETTRLGLKKRQLESKIASLQDEVEALETRKEELLSLERVERVAKEKLNLAEPRPDQVLFEDEDGNLKRQTP